MCNWGFQPTDWWCWITGSRSRNLEPLTWSHYIPSQCQESLTQQQHHIPEGWKPWFFPLNQSKIIQLNSDEPLPCTSSGKTEDSCLFCQATGLPQSPADIQSNTAVNSVISTVSILSMDISQLSSTLPQWWCFFLCTWLPAQYSHTLYNILT